MTKVMEMTRSMRMPMSCAVSKSLATARMAMPILVCLITITSAMTNRMVSTGVRIASRRTVMPPISISVRSQGILG